MKDYGFLKILRHEGVFLFNLYFLCVLISSIKFLNIVIHKTIEINKMRKIDDIKLKIDGKIFTIKSEEFFDADFGESIDGAISHVKKRSSFE